MTSDPGIGAAGPTDEGFRSDVHVRVEQRASGGMDLDLRSKVLSLYGESIRRDVTELVDRFGARDVLIEIDDRGALPFVLHARIEAALVAAGFTGDGRRPRTVPLGEPSARVRVRRSRLYLPGSEPKFMINAGLHRPDAVILDLEDSVHPDHKAAARFLVRNALRHVDFGPAERMVRINQGAPGLIDLDAVVPEGPDLVLIPKTETADQVREVAARIAALAPSGRPVWLMPILESALGIENAFEIARAHDTVVALTIGLEDYTADLGVVKTEGGTESLFARMRLVNAARAAGLQAIDSVYGNVADLDGLATWAAASRALGFEGMGCVHPRQIGPIHAAFDPSPVEIEKALRIVQAFEEAEAAGRAVVSLGSRMIDPPVVLRARRLVERARAAGLVPREGDPANGPGLSGESPRSDRAAVARPETQP